ncbi:MAG TPA: ARMT1-like domain-containing protein [Dehalococcoidia bacterium]|nr:ARMT1-like domain-containing protein [Dehalococcoidia bacterium]
MPRAEVSQERKTMKLSINCRQCLEKLVHQEAEIATTDPELRERAKEEGLSTLNKLFSYERVATDVATEIHRVLRRLTNNPDPYRQMKDKELEMSQRLFKEVRPYYGEDFRSCVKLSALGNTIDFFKELDKVSEEMKKPMEFAIDQVDEFERRLKGAKKVLYLADNAGECFFDLPLIEKMREGAQVIYVVKGSPVQNDITLEDLSRAGLIEEIGEVMTTGTDTVGVDFSFASEEFKSQFELADLVLAKGMGHYETLSEFPTYGKIAYCFMAKCQTIADWLKVPLNSYITLLQ